MKGFKNFKLLFMLLVVASLFVVGCGKSTTDDSYDGDKQSIGAEKKAEDEAAKKEAEEAKEAASEEIEETEDTTEDTTVAEPVEIVEDFGETVYPYTFIDKFGNEVTIESRPETVVSFSPELTETLFAIGAGEMVAGRSTWCDFPAEAAEVPDMGSLFDFNLENVLVAEPDVVFLSSMVSEDVYNQLVDNGITPVSLDFDSTLAGTMNYIRYVGQIMDQQEEAVALIAEIRNTINDIAARAAGREATSVYYVVSAGEYTSTATGDTFVHDIIVTTGATNVAEDGTDWMYTVEQLVEKDPDYVFCSKNWDTKSTIESLEGYKDLTAVKEGRLIEVDENIFSRQGPRVVEALLLVEEILFGE